VSNPKPARYHIISQGIQRGQDPKQALIQLSQQLNVPPKKLLCLLQKTVLLKKTNNTALAQRYKQVLTQSGFNCKIIQNKLQICPYCGQAKTQTCASCGNIIAAANTPVTPQKKAILKHKKRTNLLLILILSSFIGLYIISLDWAIFWIEINKQANQPPKLAPPIWSLAQATTSTVPLKLPAISPNVIPALSTQDIDSLKQKIQNAHSITQAHYQRQQRVHTQTTIQQQIKQLFINQNFTVIETQAKQYRDLQQRDTTGQWYLEKLHKGLNFPNKQWQQTETQIKTWLTQQPHAVIAPLVLARLYKNHAWAIRGTGYSNSVSAQNWDQFYQYIHKAYAVLQQYQQQSNIDPEWYTLMLSIARPLQWKQSQIMQIFTEGIHKTPQYIPLYLNIAEYYRPEWQGSFKAIDNIAQFAVSHTQTQAGWGLYAQIYANLATKHYKTQIFTAKQYDPNKMRQSIKDLLQQYPALHNPMLQLSCWTKDSPLFLQLLKQSNKTPSPTAWRSIQDYRDCYNWAYSLNL